MGKTTGYTIVMTGYLQGGPFASVVKCHYTKKRLFFNALAFALNIFKNSGNVDVLYNTNYVFAYFINKIRNIFLLGTLYANFHCFAQIK